MSEEKWQKRLTDADRWALSPLFWTHVNPCGRFELDMNPHLALAAAARCTSSAVRPCGLTDRAGGRRPQRRLLRRGARPRTRSTTR
ncbi:hypothetical protein [Streptomyces noursei]|uniref:hypothetical protein n=1 Tax=Streptomyces noursei TaxID=1971 RepID=UPI0030EFFAF3